MSLFAQVLSDIHQCFSNAPEPSQSIERPSSKRTSEWNGVVPAENARDHLRALRKAGVSFDLISKASKISLESIIEVKSGDRKTIRAATERAILAVSLDVRFQLKAQKDACSPTIASRSGVHQHRAIKGGPMVSSRLSIRLLEELRTEYFKDPRIARELGVSVDDIRQIGKQVSVDFESALKSLHARLMN